MSSSSLIGHTIDGKYKIERQLGKGGMGAVYLATHVGTERPVAVKVIVQQFMERPEFVERFRREARAAGRLRHPNVVDVTDFGIATVDRSETAYLVMEYLDGCTLGEILEEEKQLPLSWSLDIIQQVCSAIHEAHTQGIIHRDLKPDNIWLEPNQRGGYTVKVLDFGIAKLEEQHVDPNVGEDIHISALPTIEAGANGTLAGGRATVVEPSSTTVTPETGTVNIRPEAGTVVGPDEAGTAILSAGAPDSEDQTALFDSNATKLVDGSDGTPKNTGNPGTKAAISGTVELTRVGAVLGTPLYMSPEQCRGERLSPRSDIYSLGVITYQMLSGRTPFEGDFTAVMAAHREIDPPKLEAKKIPRRVKQVVHSALAKNLEDRPQDALAFAARLEASSDGIGALLIRAMTIFSERLPTFLAIGFLVSIPAMIVSFVRGGLNFAAGNEWIGDGPGTMVLMGISQMIAFFVQVFTAAMLVGMITWVIAQVLAIPLRPISLRTAFSKVRQRWRPLLATVTASTFIALLGWVIATIPAGIVGTLVGAPTYAAFGTAAAFIVGGAVAGLIWLVIGVAISGALGLVAPAIMMEGIKGRAAFRRSIQLTRRSKRTVFAAALLNYVVPVLLGALIGVAISGIFNKMDPSTPAAPVSAESAQADKKEDGLNIKLSGPSEAGPKIDINDPARKDKMMRRSLTTGIFEFLWAPLTALISTFTAMITALIYFKTRQAGGESMQDLLEQFEESERPQTKWQRRVQNRLIQSGRITSKP